MGRTVYLPKFTIKNQPFMQLNIPIGLDSTPSQIPSKSTEQPSKSSKFA